MKTIITVIKKELLDTFRDRRTLFTAIILPAIMFPIIFYGFSKLGKSLMDKASVKKLEIVVDNVPDDLLQLLDEDGNFSYQEFTTLDAARDGILSDSLDALIQMEKDFEDDIANLKSSKLKFFYKSTNEMVQSRIGNKIDDYKEGLTKERLEQLDITKTSIEPLNVLTYDITPKEEQLGKTIGGLLPYLFIMFCFSGCMYPAIDLITGEKEKGTMETLLTVPASRFGILVGKMLTIGLIGIIATAISLLGLFVALRFIPEIPEEFLEVISSMVNLKFAVMLLAMIIPLAIFFSGLLTSIVIRANSFKEAQSLVTPLMFIIIIPAMIAFMPTVELNWMTVWVPILNIALATKEIIAGTIHMGMYFLIVASLIVLAILALLFSVNQFSKESMVLK